MASSEEIFEKLASEGPAGPDQLLTEDEILSEEDKKRSEPKECNPNQTSSDSKPKKACANCTCGLADQLEKDKSSVSETTAPKTSCGSCYLGDAFRCASCPYRGMPAFNPGDKVTIDLGSDD